MNWWGCKGSANFLQFILLVLAKMNDICYDENEIIYKSIILHKYGVNAMYQDVLMLLQNKAPNFSKGQRQIARYITESYDKAAFMTASRLGKTLGV